MLINFIGFTFAHHLIALPIMKITDVKEKEVVHCQTEAEAIRICNLMHEAGMEWSNGQSYLNQTGFEKYEGGICYLISEGVCAEVRFFANEKYKIIPSTEITAEDELVPAPEDLFESSHVDNMPYDPELEFAEGAFDPRYARPIMANRESAKKYLEKYKETYVNFFEFGTVRIISRGLEGSFNMLNHPPLPKEVYSGEFAEVTLHPFTGKVDIKKVDENTQKEETKAERRNEGKLQWSLVDFTSLEPMVEVLGFGAEKYAPENWKRGLPVRKQIDSLLRHVTAIAAGVELDEESGLSHIGHAQCNLMFLAWTLKNKPELDDR